MNYFSPYVYATAQIPNAPFTRDGMTREQWLASGRSWQQYMPNITRLSRGDVQTLNMMRYHQ